MSRPAATQLAPGLHRLGDHIVNFYLIEEPDGLVLIDAGVPAHSSLLRDQLAELGATTADIRAVLLTHGHPDHTGLAQSLQQAGADIWVHEQDAKILRSGPRSGMRHAKPERSMVPYLLRRPAAIATPLHLARAGAFTAPAVPDVRVFDTDRRLDEVPGAPQAITLPGHTPGSAAYLFANRGLLFTGDALVTHDGLTGHIGPTLVCRGFTHDSQAALAALDRLEDLGATLVLPGHGNPMTNGPRAAVQQAREFGVH
jgi:glyoxylase-like metal-dependent hydrolase (beta-lactamase superfamily II)